MTKCRYIPRDPSRIVETNHDGWIVFDDPITPAQLEELRAKWPDLGRETTEGFEILLDA